MLVSDWLLVVFLIIGVTASHQNFNRKRSHHRNRPTLSRVPKTNTYRTLRTEARNKVNRLILLTVNPNWVTLRPQIVRKKLKRSEMRTGQTKRSMRIVTYTAFIEVDVKTAFVPKRRVFEGLESIIHSNESIKYRSETDENKPIQKTKNMNSKDFEIETDSASLDTKILSRIQELENQLNMMKVQVKNDSETIDNLKSKVKEKDQEIAELMFTNETLPVNNKIDTYKIEENRIPIDISDLTTQVMTESSQREGITHPGSAEDESEPTEALNLYVSNKRSFRKNHKDTVPSLQKVIITHRSNEGKHVDKRNIIQMEHIKDDDANSKKPKNVKNVKHTDATERHKQESDTREINAEQSIKEFAQDVYVNPNKFKNMAETKHLISAALNNGLNKKTRNDNTQTMKDIDKIQFEEKNEFVEPPNTVITEIPPTVTSEIDNLNTNDDRLIVKRRDLNIDYGEGAEQMDIPEGQVFNEDGQLVIENIGKDELRNADTEPLLNKKNPFFNSNEFKKKLNEERIEDAIDWKTFNHNAFLKQISAELKERTRMDRDDEEISTIVPFNGRRMLSDKAINLTGTDISPDNADKLMVRTTTEMFAPAPPGQMTQVLLSDMAIIIPPAPLEVKDDYPQFNPSPPEIAEVSRSPLAPEAGKQKLVIDSSEDLIRNAYRRFNAGKPRGPQTLDFDVYKQKLHRTDGKEREMLYKKVAERMNAKISGRRNMNERNIGAQYDISEEVLKDPFLNDTFI